MDEDGNLAIEIESQPMESQENDVNGGGGDGSGGGAALGSAQHSSHGAGAEGRGSSSRTTPGLRGPFGGAGGAGAEASSGGAVGGAATPRPAASLSQGDSAQKMAVDDAAGPTGCGIEGPNQDLLFPAKKPAAKETPKQKRSAAQKPEKRKAKSKPSSSDIPNTVYLLILVFCHLSYLKI